MTDNENDNCVYAYLDPSVEFDGEILGVPLDREPYYVGHGDKSRWLTKLRSAERSSSVRFSPTDERTRTIVKSGGNPVPTMLAKDIPTKDEASKLAALAESQIAQVKAYAFNNMSPTNAFFAGPDGGVVFGSGAGSVSLSNSVPLMALANSVAVAQAETGSSSKSGSALYQSARRHAARGAIPAHKLGNSKNSWVVGNEGLDRAVTAMWPGATEQQKATVKARAEEAKRATVPTFSLLKDKE